MSLLPVQSPPVRRPEVIAPHRAVDVVHGTPEQLVAMRMRLLHGANFNDPAPYALADPERLRASTAPANMLYAPAAAW